MDLLNLSAALPELLLAGGAMLLLMFGVFTTGEVSVRVCYWGSVLLLIAAAVLAAIAPAHGAEAFSGVFVSDAFSRFAKVIIFGSAAVVLIIGHDYLGRAGMRLFEFPILALFAALGMAMMVSANDLIALYVGLELQSLSLYVLAAFRRDSARSTEAGLKYFVLGALSSGLLLLGASYVYGFTGATGFGAIAAVIGAGDFGVGLSLGLALIVCGLAFKVSAAPFHMWTPDVYEGAPGAVTAFFATAPKMAAMALFARVMLEPFGLDPEAWRQIIAILAAASVIVGGFAAIGQTNIKRLMAYSSIGHMGYALMGLAAGDAAGAQAMLHYMAVYVITNLGVFAFILSMRRDGTQVAQISDLAGLAERNRLTATCLAALMLSLMGIPPLAGFIVKYDVFMAAISVDLIWLAVIGGVMAVVSGFYYLRIIKVMFFDEPAPAFDSPARLELSAVLLVSAAAAAIYMAPGLVDGFGLPAMAGDAAAAVASPMDAPVSAESH